MTENESALRRRRVVVGVDGSTGSKAALTWAADKSSLLGQIQPIASWRYPFWAAAPSAPNATGAPPREWFESQARNVGREAANMLEPADRLDPVVMHGHAGRVLCRSAADAALLVVGSRGRTALTETALGSTSSYCASHTTSPLAIIPEAGASAGMSVVAVGIDGSANSIAALTWVLDHAPDGAHVHAVLCLAPIGPAFEIVLTYRDAHRERAQAALDDAIGNATEHTVRSGPLPDVSGAVVIGDPRAVLHDYDAELVVVGARGHRGVSHLLLGSVATSLAHQTVVPTIIVPA